MHDGWLWLHVYTVPTPNVLVTALNNQQVGDPLLLECNVTTVRGITSSVDIVWSKNDVEVERTSNVSEETVNNSVVYTSVHNATGGQNGSVYSCTAVLNNSSMSTATHTMWIGKGMSIRIISRIKSLYPTLTKWLQQQQQKTSFQN